MKQSNQNSSPRSEQDLEQWQKQSESKFPPGAPPRRLHELPRFAASNAAAATPTIVEEVNVPPGKNPAPPKNDEIPPGDKSSRDSSKPFVKKTAIERLENEGGTTDAEDPDIPGEASHPRRGYDIVT
ncbi:MAG: hypothetical protein ACKV19_28570 [Verrucomicrobiales bacterium]